MELTIGNFDKLLGSSISLLLEHIPQVDSVRRILVIFGLVCASQPIASDFIPYLVPGKHNSRSSVPYVRMFVRV
jgi:hypothetical protein